MSFRPKRSTAETGFSPPQQGEFRQLVELAWIAYCQAHELDPKARCKGKRCQQCDFCQWYERQLYVATGQTSTSNCNRGRDYDWTVRQFEGIAGIGIKWALRCMTGDVKRMMWSLKEELGEKYLRVACVDEVYLEKCIKNGYKGAKPWEMSREKLIAILGEVKAWVRTHIRHVNHVAEETAQAMAPVEGPGIPPAPWFGGGPKSV